MATVGARFDGGQIVLDESVELVQGQRLFVTIIDPVSSSPGVVDSRVVDLGVYTGRGKKLFPEAGEADAYVRELRANDRV